MPCEPVDPLVATRCRSRNPLAGWRWGRAQGLEERDPDTVRYRTYGPTLLAGRDRPAAFYAQVHPAHVRPRVSPSPLLLPPPAHDWLAALSRGRLHELCGHGQEFIPSQPGRMGSSSSNASSSGMPICMTLSVPGLVIRKPCRW